MELSHFCCLHRSDQLFEACLRVLHRFVTDFSRDLLGQCHHHQHQVGPGAHVGVKFPQLTVNNLERVTWRARMKLGVLDIGWMEKCPGRRSDLKNLENAPAKKKKKTKLNYYIIHTNQEKSNRHHDALIDFTTSIFQFQRSSLDGRRSWLHIASPSCCPGDSRDE